jgi:hypothetical protein
VTVKTDIQTAAPSLNGSRRPRAADPAPRPLNHSPVPPKAKGVSTLKATAGAKAKQAAQRPSRAARAASKPEKLVCRYCGSDDLAPSFIKRRDARCRGCFKQRYGSSGRGMTRKAAGAQKSKAAK